MYKIMTKIENLRNEYRYLSIDLNSLYGECRNYVNQRFKVKNKSLLNRYSELEAENKILRKKIKIENKELIKYIRENSRSIDEIIDDI